jgi:hypothetical protein
MSLKDEYFAIMVSRFKRWDAELGMLGDKAGQASGAADARFEEQLKALRATRNATYSRLQEIRTAIESGGAEGGRARVVGGASATPAAEREA